jgi:N6-adenosine-specific RNA methylase IME4
VTLYRTIVADPPWPYERGLTGVTRVGRELRQRGVENYYDTMPIRMIKALGVPDLADRTGCHLYLWTTNHHIRAAFDVMDAWGFTYKALLTWVKQGNIGLGYHWRNQTEHVLFGMMGSYRTSDRARTNVFAAPKTGHSSKPEAFYDIVESMSAGPYLELFARRNRLGWDTWGNEALEMVQL